MIERRFWLLLAAFWVVWILGLFWAGRAIAAEPPCPESPTFSTVELGASSFFIYPVAPGPALTQTCCIGWERAPEASAGGYELRVESIEGEWIGTLHVPSVDVTRDRIPCPADDVVRRAKLRRMPADPEGEPGPWGPYGPAFKPIAAVPGWWMPDCDGNGAINFDDFNCFGRSFGGRVLGTPAP